MLDVSYTNEYDQFLNKNTLGLLNQGIVTNVNASTLVKDEAIGLAQTTISNIVGNEDIKSGNFLTGKYGWRIDGQGNVEFNDGTFRGDLTGASGTFTDADAIIIGAGGNILLKEGGNIRFTSIPAPTACVATLVNTSTGNVVAGTHTYKITFVNGSGETEIGVASNTVTTDATHKQVNITGIPISTNSGVIARKIYRTNYTGSSYFYLATISDNTTTTYTDNSGDDPDPSFAMFNFKANDTFGKLYVDGKEILSTSSANTFLGQDCGNSTVRSSNVGIGRQTLLNNTFGYSNTAIGTQSLQYNVRGDNNCAVGQASLFGNLTGYGNVSIGAISMLSNETGNNNTCVGYGAMAGTTGDSNVAIGVDSLVGTSGSGSVGLGSYSGKYDTAGNSFFVNNQDRTNLTGDRTKSLLYGIFATTADSQKLTLNGLLNLSVTKTPATAGATGVTGDIAWDSSYLYVCTATNTWKRTLLSTW